MIRGADTLQMRRNSAFVHNHSSCPSWPALAQGFHRAKQNLAVGPEEASTRHDQVHDSGNVTGPGMHWHGRFWPGSGNTARENKRRKAPGPDGVTPVCLKSRTDQLAPIFTQIFNRSLELCEVPSCFKCSTIIPSQRNQKLQDLMTTDLWL